jgi:FtsP/CotA-like multicopper oxidase with cupredoxin domain/uncharacterized membrane protein
MLIPFPIALLVAAFAADIALWWTGYPFWARAALWLSGTGAVSGILAAAFGLTDFVLVNRARVHSVGWVHAIGAGATLILALASWLSRLDDPIGAALPWGLVLSTLTVGAVAVTGWAGGELPYRHLVGVTGHGPHDSHEPHAAHQPAAPDHSEAGGPDAAAGHGGMGHPPGNPALAVTGPQKAAMSVLTVLALVAAVVWSASRANLSLGAKDVGGLIMPPGMVMTRHTNAETMRNMAAVDPRQVRFTAPADARGDQPLPARIEDGVKVYDLETSVVRWSILPGVRVTAYAYNRQVPGPRIRITEGDRVRFRVTNHLPESTTVHWHGLVLPNRMDGPADITQRPIEPGETFTYEFVARQAGTFFYHSHDDVDRQQALGLYGALIVDPRDPAAQPAHDQELVVQLQEWLERDGYTYPAMPMEGALPNYFTINGKAYPATETVHLHVGQRLLVRFIGSSSAFIHPMHIHGGPFQILATDGSPTPPGSRSTKDTINVAPGERYDVLWPAREPGKWLLHCHINHHVTNNGTEQHGGGGLTLILDVEP